MEQNWITFTPYGLIKNLWYIHPRDSHVEFMGKNEVGNTTWTKLRGLIGQEKIAKTSKEFWKKFAKTFKNYYFSAQFVKNW